VSAARTGYATRVRLDRAALWQNARPLLTWLDIELTERCNLDCIHCSINRPAGDLDARSRELRTEEVEHLLESAAALGCLTVRFTGGEPLLRDDFEEIYLFARKIGIRVMLFTNATLITPQLAGLLARVPPREKIEVSVYGMRESSCEAVTGTPGSFEAARRGIGLLLERRIPFIVKSALLPANKGEMSEFESWASGLSGQTERTAWAMFFDLRSRRDNGKNDLIRRLRISPEEALRLAALRAESDGAELKRFVAQHAGIHGDRLFTCLSERGKGAIDAYGTFQYCLLLRHPDTVYDLKLGSLRAAVMDHVPIVRAMKARNPEYLRRCGRCFLKAFCLQCPARSWAEHGTLDTPVDYLCDVAHAQAAALGFLGKGEKAWAVRDWQGRVGRLSGPRPRGGGGSSCAP